MHYTQGKLWLAGAGRVIRVLEDVCGGISGFLFIVCIVFSTAQVIARYFFNSPLWGYYDITEWFLPLAGAGGWAYVQRRRGHVRVDLLIGRLKGRKRAVGEFLNLLTATTLYSFILYWYVSKTIWAFEMGHVTHTILLPQAPAWAVVGVFVVLLVLRLYIQTFQSLRQIVRGEWREGS